MARWLGWGGQADAGAGGRGDVRGDVRGDAAGDVRGDAQMWSGDQPLAPDWQPQSGLEGVAAQHEL